ncbi:aldehyde dehydrogenase family protein [Herbaspirillum rubrisubalbicans]|uniref:Aldehyde dehydrogenase n=1 Tax=Herbaspirillum rubrisubalbicans TaxID=80842 RepID=A0AAD0U4K7_9BURK|nr:aldehyde dehydrogenase family protein [Herbaspirillum rubrisubalbicans]ALU88037.1 NAD-dependent aldehyde dehydrogenase protein [Herbaspirillum rubrisubalbicans M1]AYR23117.1 aldehyde dehydrogenase [Herbaspirillum rubrisubalbicans]
MSVSTYFDTMDYGPAPESDKDARAWLASHEASFGHFIGGRFTRPGAQLEDVDPASGKLLAHLTQGSPADVEAAVNAAQAALPDWQALGGHGRARHLYALARSVQRHARLLAVLETLDNGKPLRESRDIDVPLVARHFYHYAGWAQLQEREFPDHVPLGVVGQIVPWNFPLLMLAWKIAPALALGNTVVLKPAETTSLSALLFAELAQQAGLPAGVLNIVTGDGATGAAVVAHPGIQKIAFTGSTEVGRLIRQQTAGSGKSLTLELGGKSPFIVFEDADIDAAIEGVVDAIWFNQGQVCCAGSRLLVQEGIHDLFIARLKTRMEKLKVGAPLDKCSDMGALISAEQLQRVKRLVEQGVREGAQCHQVALQTDPAGCFYPPTLLTSVHPACTVATEEIFGPVLVAMSFRTPDEAVQLANNSRYGLAASIWSETIGLALGVAPQLKAGVVWINSTNQFDAAVGFGGYRESGYGREGGREGCYEYLKPRHRLGRALRQAVAPRAARQDGPLQTSHIDRTAKLYIGGKQVRPDGEVSMACFGAQGERLEDVGLGNRKDIRNAVAAAVKAGGWSSATGHRRAQALYYIAENLSARSAEFARRISATSGVSPEEANAEVDAAIRRLFSYGAWADKFEGAVHQPPMRGVALAMPEAIGVIGVVCPEEKPLLSFISLVAPAIAMGNRVVVVPSQQAALVATDLYQVLDTSDLPAGVINIVTGKSAELLTVLAEHDEVDALWVRGPAEFSATAERLSIGNLKRCFVDYGQVTDWHDIEQGEGSEYLRQATQIKNIWIPYGE